MGYADAEFGGVARPGLPHRLHRRARLRAAAAVGSGRRGVRRAGRGGRRGRWRARRARRPRHAAHRDGLPAARSRTSPDISPLQARCGWAVGWRKDAFWGRDALLAEKEAGPRRVLRGLRALDRGVLRADTDGARRRQGIGVTTSGTFSPTLKVGIALALIDTAAGIADGQRSRSTCAAGPGSARSSTPPFVRGENSLGHGVIQSPHDDRPLEFARCPQRESGERRGTGRDPARPRRSGSFHTDHMVSIDYADGQGWHDARVLPVRADRARPVGDRAALRAGDLRGAEGVPLGRRLDRLVPARSQRRAAAQVGPTAWPSRSCLRSCSSSRCAS